MSYYIVLESFSKQRRKYFKCDRQRHNDKNTCWMHQKAINLMSLAVSHVCVYVWHTVNVCVSLGLHVFIPLNNKWATKTNSREYIERHHFVLIIWVSHERLPNALRHIHIHATHNIHSKLTLTKSFPWFCDQNSSHYGCACYKCQRLLLVMMQGTVIMDVLFVCICER